MTYRVNHHLMLYRAVCEIFPNAITARAVHAFQHFDKETKTSTYLVAYRPGVHSGLNFEWFEITLPNRYIAYLELLESVRYILSTPNY